MSEPVDKGPNHATTVSSGTLIMGTYEIERLINAGGMGEVYRGRNIHNDEPVAIKIVLPSLAHDPKIVALFQKESTTLSRLSHEAIVRYHVFTVDPTIGRPCMVMEFVSGTALSDRIESGPMPVADVRVMLRRVASGLDKAHRAGVVHRDLSPDNVILEEGQVEHAKLIDFGIAKSTALGAGTLLQGQFAGKFNWVSPEQLGAFGGAVDGRSDIYSLALVTAAASKGEVLPMGASIVDAVGKRSGVPDLTGVDEGLALRPESMAQVIAAVDNPALVPQIAPPAPKAPDPNRTVIGGSLPIPPVKEVSEAPASVPPVSVAPVSVVPVTAKTSAPVGATVISAVTAPPEAEDVSPFGAPGMAAVVAPHVDPVVVKNSKSGLIAVVALLALGGGAAGAYFGGVFDGKAVPAAGETQADAEARVKAEAEQQAADAAATKAAEEAAAAKAAADAKAAEDAAKQAEAEAAAKKAADSAAAQKVADEAAAKLAAEQAAAQKAEADAAAQKAAEAAAAQKAAEAAAAQKAAEDAAAKQAAEEAAAKEAAEAKRLADEAAAQKAADAAAAQKAAEDAAAQKAAEEAAQKAAAEKAAKDAAAAQKLADEAAAKKAAEEAAAKVDPVAAQRDYLAGLKPPLCALVTVKAAKASGFALDGYTADPAALAGFAADWQAATQTKPDLATHIINATQCPLIEFANRAPTPAPDPLAVVMQTPSEVVKSGDNVSGKVEGLNGRSFALFIFSEGGGATNLKPWTTMDADGSASFEFNLTLEPNAPPAPQILVALVTDKPLPALDKVPAGVTAQSLMPFLEKQLQKAGVTPTLGFAYFRLEN
jgi:serine/threonine-protein kinase